ncbi:hypothetical protein F2Q70_00022648 [Brassica cretica]|uniref:MATH domain-containing protein n=1 Tax=Brassica cretica TaxID=69181 RepID=A0A8S9GP96_BRACR|nr:hypothetical protein F2Q70_00022648 [Brassica cretica]KAF3609570.1 hypothetical protein DY000_02049317 [Brassica cretica]
MLDNEKSRVVSDSTITSMFGDRPPYLFHEDSKPISTQDFLVWRLVIYPKGNKKDNGAGFNFTVWKPFNALRPVHGFPQVLPLDTFNDYKDGYAFDGNQWEFSVDVMVPLTNWEVVSFTQKPSKPDFCWTVNKFSKLKEHRYGHVVVSQGRDYIRSQIDIHLSEVKPDKDTLKAGEQIYTKADVRILTHLESLDKEV